MRNKKFKNTEWAIVIVSIMLFVIGLVALFSATQSTEYGEFKKQLQWFAFSIPVLIVVSIIDYNIIIRFSPLLFTVLLLALVGVLFTEPINGASSWFKIGDFLAIQPSELGKIVAILFWALILNKLQLKGKREINKIWKLFLFMIAYLVPAFLIIKQPDYGTAAAYTVAFLFMLFVSGLDKKYIITALVLVVILIPVSYMYILPEHAKTRIDVFLNPELDPRGAGYNIMQSKLAIGSGQLVGMGLLKGNQTQLGFLSPKTTDFIFSVIGEEMGFIATGAIVILYIILVTKTIYIAKTAKDNLGSYIAIGIAGIFFFHMAENIGMTIGLLPITGVPLPFVSYGGSSLITNFMCIGLLLNISSRRQKSIFVDGMM